MESKTQMRKKSQGLKRSGGRNNVSRAQKGDSLTQGGSASVNTMVYQPWMPVFPAHIIKKLRYSTSVSLACVSGATATHVFRANDLFDPDFTGTGHQPLGFDQLMVWYNHFTVKRAKLIAVFKNVLATSPTCSLRVDGDSTAITVYERVIEIGGNVMENLEAKGGYGANKVLSLSVDIAKLQSVLQSTITADSTLQGSAAASPSEITYFHVQLWDTTAATGGAQVDVIIEYEAQFGEPRPITQS